MQLRDKARARRQSGTFLIEGVREITLAVNAGYKVEMLLMYLPLYTEEQATILAANADMISITKEIYEKLAYRESTEGLIALVKSQNHDLDHLQLSENPLVLIAEAPEKPGNIGALLRTADAAHVDAVIIANPKSDLYNPNIIRSSVGCLFTVPIATATTNETIEWLNGKNINIYSATLQEATSYHLQDFTGPTAIVVGTEAEGLSKAWREASKKNIMIPMQGAIDSMNVSVAAAVLVFEAKRQRGFN